MMTSDQAIDRVRGSKESEIRAIADATGVPKATLDKIRYGVTADPRNSTVRKLVAYFDSQLPADQPAEHG